MSKLRQFIGGAALSNLMVLNYVYEQESLKQSIRDEIHKLENINNFQANQLVKFRNKDLENRQRRVEESQGISSLQIMDHHYKYFNHQILNALKESFYRTSIKPTILMQYFQTK